jgi:hypothetical protein
MEARIFIRKTIDLPIGVYNSHLLRDAKRGPRDQSTFLGYLSVAVDVSLLGHCLLVVCILHCVMFYKISYDTLESTMNETTSTSALFVDILCSCNNRELIRAF